jgi:hypothetical protein
MLDLVDVAAADAPADDVLLVDEVGDDALGGALRDAHPRGDVAGPDLRIARDAEQDRRVVGHEGP